MAVSSPMLATMAAMVSMYEVAVSMFSARSSSLWAYQMMKSSSFTSLKRYGVVK